MSYKDALKNPQCKASYHQLNGGKLPTSWLKPKEEELEEVRGNKYINSSRDLPEPPFGYFYYNGKLCKNKRMYKMGGNIEGGFRPLTQKQFHSLPPEHQQHHIQLAHHHHLAGGKVPKWLQKIGNFAKNVGNKIKDTAVKIGQNPTVKKIGAVAKNVGEKVKHIAVSAYQNPIIQKMGREALYYVAPPLRVADPLIKVVQEHTTNEIAKTLGEQGRPDLEGQGRIMWKPSKKLTEEEYKAQGYRPETNTDRWTKSIKKYHPEDATTEDGRRLIYKGKGRGQRKLIGGDDATTALLGGVGGVIMSILIWVARTYGYQALSSFYSYLMENDRDFNYTANNLIRRIRTYFGIQNENLNIPMYNIPEVVDAYNGLPRPIRIVLGRWVTRIRQNEESNRQNQENNRQNEERIRRIEENLERRNGESGETDIEAQVPVGETNRWREARRIHPIREHERMVLVPRRHSQVIPIIEENQIPEHARIVFNGRGRLFKKEKYYQEHNPYEHLKKGAFTRDLNAFNKKHNKKHSLKQFAMLIAKHPTSFKPLERKRALFYLNMIV